MHEVIVTVRTYAFAKSVRNSDVLRFIFIVVQDVETRLSPKVGDLLFTTTPKVRPVRLVPLPLHAVRGDQGPSWSRLSIAKQWKH